MDSAIMSEETAQRRPQMTDLLLISLHADPSMPPGIGVYGGGHMYPKELLIGLSQKDFRVSLLTRKSYSNLPEIEHINKNCTIYRMDYGNCDSLDKREFYQLREKSFALASKIIKENHLSFQLIHSIYWNSGQLALQLSRVYKVPFVHSIISNGKQILECQAKEIEPHRIDVETLVFQEARHLFCITQSERQAIEQYYGIPGEKIHVIGRPVDSVYQFPVHNDLGCTRNITWKDSPYLLPLYQKKHSGAVTGADWWRRQVFTYVGRIDLNKGIDVILSAWHSLYEKYGESCPAIWFVGGTPDEIDDFHNTIPLDLRPAENAGKLIWWGTLNAEGISSVYLRTLTVIMHSKYEPGGRVSLEAMTEGIPVIATKCGFAGDMIQDWENGFLVDYGDANALAKRMEHFIWQPYLSHSLGNGAKSSAQLAADHWGFLPTHIRVYGETLKQERANNRIASVKQANAAPDYVNVYPYINFIADETVVRAYLKNGLNRPEFSIEQQSASGYCFRWNVSSNGQQYTLYQPYSYMNKAVFRHDSKKYSNVHSCLRRYQIHKYWSSRLPSDTVCYDDGEHMFLCATSACLDIKSALPDIIAYIQKYSNMDFEGKSAVSEKMASMLKSQFPVEEIWMSYHREAEQNPWYADGNFSYSFESKALLHAFQTDESAAQQIGADGLALLREAARMDEPEGPFLLSGFVSEESSFYGENGQVLVHNCEYLHPARFGEDFARLFLQLAVSEDILDWENTLNFFPASSRQDILLWSNVLVCQKALLRHNMETDKENSTAIPVQTRLLQELYRRLQLS